MNQKFKRALIFINGNEKDLTYTRQHISKDTLLVGCDGGTDKIYDLGLSPHAVIGDFDSISSLPHKINNLPENQYGKETKVGDVIYIKYSKDKDFLDVEVAINYVLEKGLRDIILVNTAGDELDHVIGVLMLLAKNKYRSANIKIIRPGQVIYIIRGKAEIKGETGDKISLIPLYGPVSVGSSSGLKYDPSEYRMSLQHNIGISNELITIKATLDINKGCFLVIHHYNL